MRILILVALITNCLCLHAKVLEVGVALRFDDKFNTTVAMFREGIETAKVLFEKKHPGTKVSLQHFSHGPEMASVVSASDRIIQSGVAAVIGPEMSDEAIVMGDTLAPRKIIMITHTASNPKVTENKPYVFRTCFSDTAVAERLADYVVKKLGPKKIGILHNISSPYSDYLSTRFIESVRRLSSSDQASPEILVQKVLRRAQDYSDEIDFFKSKGITHLVNFTFDTDFSRFVLQAGRKGFFPFYIGSDGWGSNEYVFDRLVKESEFGRKFTGIRNSYWKEDLKSPLADQFRKLYVKTYHHRPNAWHASAFDAAWVLFHAMDRAKNPKSSEQIRKELKKVTALPVVTSQSFTFGPENSPKKDLYLYRIAKDGVQYEATLQ